MNIWNVVLCFGGARRDGPVGFFERGWQYHKQNVDIISKHLTETNTTTSTSFTSADILMKIFKNHKTARFIQFLLRDISTSISAKKQKFSSWQPCISALFLTSDPTEDLATHFFVVNPCHHSQISLITEIESH